MYKIDVRFKTWEGWSDTLYTYKSNLSYKENEAVVVPTGNFYAVARVQSCTENGVFPLNAPIRRVLCSITEIEQFQKE
jgi:hypothetical protein